MTKLTPSDELVDCRPPDLEHYLDVGTQRLFIAEWNPDAAETVLLLHGLGVQSYTWAPAATALASSARVVAFDFRGHGLSDWSSEGYPLDAFVSDTLHVIDRCDLNDVVVAGHSLGTRVGIGAAGRAPERIRGLFLSDGGPVIPVETSRTLKDVEQTRQRSYESEHDAATDLARIYPSWTSQFVDLHVRHQFRRNWMGKMVTRTDPEIRWLYHEDYWHEYDQLWDELASVTCPVKLLWPTNSGHVTEEIVERMHEVLDDFDVVRVDGGHFYPRERPTAFISMLREFITESYSRESKRLE